jgi:hypothetical protein
MNFFLLRFIEVELIEYFGKYDAGIKLDDVRDTHSMSFYVTTLSDEPVPAKMGQDV